MISVRECLCKAIPYMDLKLGHKVEPPKQDRNARRMEMFIFDAFQLCKSVVGLQAGGMGVLDQLNASTVQTTAVSRFHGQNMHWSRTSRGPARRRRQCRHNSSCCLMLRCKDIFVIS